MEHFEAQSASTVVVIDIRRPGRTPAAAATAAIVDDAAFEVVFRGTFADVHRFLARRVGTDLADDLAAETFAVAYRRRTSYDPARGTARVWIFGIAAKVLRGHWRDERRSLALQARLGRTVGIACVSDARHDDPIDTRLASALRRLPRKHREVLLLQVWGQLTSEEVAAALGIRPGTVRSRVSRAREQLRAALNDELGAAREPEGAGT